MMMTVVVVMVVGGALDRRGHAREVVERLANAIRSDVSNHALDDWVSPLRLEPVLGSIENGRRFG